MDAKHFQLVRDSWALVKPKAEEFFKEFYSRLFVSDPKLELVFEKDMVRQQRMLNAVVDLLLYNPENFSSIRPNLVDLGGMHRKMGVSSIDYMLFIETMVGTVEHYCGDAWTAETGIAWREVLKEITQVMQGAEIG